jgi:hypothetical protein
MDLDEFVNTPQILLTSQKAIARPEPARLRQG